jgi:hypothetical protein
MKLSLPIILGKMTQRNARLYLSNDTRELLSARLLTPKTLRFDRCAVYIGKTGDILSMKNAALPDNMICVGKGDIRPLIEADKYNIIYIEGDGVLEVHNEAQDIFDFYNQIDNELMNAILQEKDLQSILDICTRFFDNPVYIIDAAQKLISFSSNLIDPEWQNLQATGFVGVDVVNSLKKLDQLGLSAQMVQLDSIPPFLSVVIYDKNEKIGSVGVRQYYSSISEDQLSLLRYVGEVLTVAISKENYSRYVRTSYANRFMIDMLKGTTFEVSFVMHNLSQLGWRLDDDYYILKILPDPKDIAGGTVKYSGELIKKMFTGSVLLSIGDVLALIVNTRYCQDTLADAFRELDAFLEKRNFTCGVSMVFKDFTNLFEQYKLAGAATEIGSLVNRDKRLFRYEDYIMPHMISICDQTFNVTALCHLEAVKLHEHDKKTGNSYFYCLYVYLLNEKSLLVTARQLNIHRSTLIYRLSKIAEIITVDLNDQKLRMHLIFSYEILHFLDCLRG